MNFKIFFSPINSRIY